MDSTNPENYIAPLTFPQKLEARMQFDPDMIRVMLAFNAELLAKATDPLEIEEIVAHEAHLNGLLQRLEF